MLKLRKLLGNWLITGGSGYLGRAVIERAEREGWDVRFTAYARHEDTLSRLKALHPKVRCVPGDILDLEHLTSVAVGHDGILHAGAMKRVPESEDAVDVTVAINVGGTRNAARAAVDAGVETAVLVSTDKACLPVNLYGATKMVAERIWAEANLWGATRFATARYGNVIGSTGSIVPVFRRQLEQTGRITVTDPAMTRFWMPIGEAIDTILTAAEWAPVAPGTVFASRCRAMPIGELARLMVTEWYEQDPGHAGADDVIDVVGVRPGEKMHETLVHEYEMARALERPEGFAILPSTYSTDDRLSHIVGGLAAGYFEAIGENDSHAPFSSDTAAPLPVDVMRSALEESAKYFS